MAQEKWKPENIKNGFSDGVTTYNVSNVESKHTDEHQLKHISGSIEVKTWGMISNM